MFPVLPILGVELPSYAVLITVGYCIGFLIVLRRRYIYDLPKKNLIISYLMAGVGSILGGKIFYVLQGLPLYFKLYSISGMSIMLYIANAGFVYYGGLIGCIGFVWFTARWMRYSFWSSLDTLLPALPFAQTFGRVGCFLAGCCYGIPSSFGFFMNPSSSEAIGTRLIPVQLMEGAGTFVIFWWLSRYGNKKRLPGAMLGRYLTGYGILRFILEFFRGDSIRGHLGVLSVAQWFSIGAVVIGAMILNWSERASTNSENIAKC